MGLQEGYEKYEDFCSSPHTNGVVLSAASLLCFIIVCGLLLKLHILRTRARAGDEEAASALVLPSYRYIIFAFAGTYLVDGLYDFLWGSRDDCLVPRRLVLCLSLALRRGCIDGTALFFTFHGAGRRSIRTTLCITIPWALVVGGIEYLWDTDQCRDNHESINTDFRDVNILTLPAIAKALECMYIFILLVCYGALAVVPAYRLYRRPSLDFKFVWWQLLTIILLGVETFMDIMDYEHGHCLHWYYIVLLQCILGPFVFMATLRADSAYWQGLLAEKDFGGLFSPSSQNDSVASPRARASSASVRTSTFQRSMTITEPLLGQYLEKEAAEELAITMDLLSEAPNCEFIHFGLLSLEAKPINHDSADTAAQFDIIGVGGASKVYRGRYRDEPVAIKMIWCVDITTEIIQQFKQEVMILAQLAKHPNIIQVRGISVMPPALCVVMELCNRGSLFDVLHESVSSSAPPSPSQREEPTEGSPTPTSSPSPKVPLPWETRLRLACECAEALTFLHSREPPIVHKDIKSANFLIVEDEATHRLHVRLADLGSAIEVMQAELSTGSNSESSQEAPMAHQKPGLLFHSSSNNKLGSFADPDGERRRTSGSIISRNSSLKWNSFSSDEWAGSDAITPNWAAPEVLLEGLMKIRDIPGAFPDTPFLATSEVDVTEPEPRQTTTARLGEEEVYTPAADVFSLGVVLWELLTCEIPFPSWTFTQIAVRVGREHLRPHIPRRCPEAYAELLTRMWHRSPSSRPTAAEVRRQLRRILRATLAGESKDSSSGSTAATSEIIPQHPAASRAQSMDAALLGR